MVAVASSNSTAASSSAVSRASPATAAVTAKTPSSAKPTSPAATVELSEQSKALLDKLKADLAAANALDDSFDEILAKRNDALSARLAKDFAAMNIPPEFATNLQVDKFGNVTAEGAWKKKIEKLFSDVPELAKELKAVANLSAMKAAQTSLDMYLEEKATSDPKKQNDAWTRYNIRSMNIQTLSGVMTLKDGKLRAAAVDFIDMLADPNGMSSLEKTKDAVNRLA